MSERGSLCTLPTTTNSVTATFMSLAILLCTSFTIISVSSQMCQNYGQQCFDHSNCCGGCCRKNVCVDSVYQCSSSEDHCRTIYCPPGLSCYLYQLPGCPGCPIVPYCRLPFTWEA